MLVHCLVRLLRAYVRQAIVNLNLFESDIPAKVPRERWLTRVFIVLMIVASIAVGCYVFLIVSNQVVIVAHPSLDTYLGLQGEHDSSLTCPCSQLSMPYGTFLNISSALHQICSSDLVSPEWLDYLASFDPTHVPPWTETSSSRDFRTIGASYFQFLANFCFLTRVSLENAQHAFLTGQFTHDRALSPSRFHQRIQTVINSFITDTKNEFTRSFDWIDVLLRSSFFFSGTNVNFQVTVSADDQVHTEYPVFHVASGWTHHSVDFSGVCSCLADHFLCWLTSLIYTNGSHTLDFEQVFSEMPISCVLATGFLYSDISWWYNDSYLANIRETYSLVIDSRALPKARGLNASVPSQFGSINLGQLLREMLLERWISDGADFGIYYKTCAPVACSYTVTRRRDIFVALLLLVSICGGLNQGLRILVPFVGRLAFVCVDRWTNRAMSVLTRASVGTRFKRLPRRVYRSIVDMNLFKTTATDDDTCRQQRIYTRVYLTVFLSCLSVLLFYNAVVERSASETHWSPTVDDFERLHDRLNNGLSCPCTKVSIPYGDFVIELLVDSYHQVCIDDNVRILLLRGNDAFFHERAGASSALF